MSQFRETFTKEDKQDNLLDYDDTASLYFIASLLACIIIPITIHLITHLLLKSKAALLQPYYPLTSRSGSSVVQCKCSQCVMKREKKTSEVCSLKHRLKFSIKIEMGLVVILWICFVYACAQMSEVEQLGGFDPFKILGIESGADDKAIKKAYRQMSLKFHPDKNPTDPTAGAKFLLISKAHKSLTDEVAKMNYEKYGNPDGPGVMKIGIGLPRYLVDKPNQLPILCLFFLIMLIIVPLLFILYYNRQRRYYKGVQRDTYHILCLKMAANSRTAHLPEILASSVESRELPLTSHVDDLTELSKKVVFYAKPFEKDATLIKNTTLVLAHLQRLHDSLSDSLNEDLITLLSKSIPISSAMLEVAITHEWVMTAVNVLDFRRRLVQALGVGASSLLQVPHLTPDIVKGLSKVKSVTVKELHELIAHRAVVLDQTQKLKSLTDEQTLDVRAVTQHISDMSLIASICVEDETDMVVGDTATCNFTLTRQNLREGEAMGAVHAPFFPGVKFEEWVAFLIDKRTGNLHGLAASKSPERVIEEKIKFRLVRPGEFLYQLLVVCDSHTGLDKVMDLQFKVFSQKERPREIVVHEEDEALDNEPSLMSLMMNGQNGEEAVDSSDEEEEASPEANLPEVSDGEEEVDEDDEESE